jgi:hypothetical protein
MSPWDLGCPERHEPVRAAEVRRWRDRLPLSLSLDTIGDESLADATAVELCVEAHLAGVGFGLRPFRFRVCSKSYGNPASGARVSRSWKACMPK